MIAAPFAGLVAFGMSMMMRIILLIYVAQAAGGFAVGFVLPWFW
jgi:hypothetical protein